MFDQLLLDAVRKTGSILAVAQVLGVQPKTVYTWIAGFEHPKSSVQNGYSAALAAILGTDDEAAPE